jgi:hypothetical protein
VSAALATVLLLPATAEAQVNPFRGGHGLSPEDKQLLFERVVRLNAAEPASLVAAAQPVPAETVQLLDGTWTVQATRIPGSRRCGEWLVRLTNARGQLSGVVSQARSTVPMQNLLLMPDVSFSGTTPERLVGRNRAPASKVIGQFSGETVTLTFESERCPASQGTATRRAARGEAAASVVRRAAPDPSCFN